MDYDEFGTYNVDLPAQLPMQSDGNFFIHPLPEVWYEIIQETVPIVMDILEQSPTFLAGGFLRQMLDAAPLSPEITDIDLFFQHSWVFESVKSFLENLDGFEKVFQCPENKLATFVHKPTGWKYQCIAVDFYPTTLDVVESFDFTTTCFGTNGKEFVFHKDAVSDTLNKNLRWNKITHPASSLRRMMKYARKGFAMSESEYQYFVDCVANHSSDIVDFKMVYVD